MKYVIKNRPFNRTTAHFCLGGKDIEYCKNVANCLLKRIVDKCKMGVSDKTLYIILENKNRKDMWLNSSTEALLEILKLFEIEECENE